MDNSDVTERAEASRRQAAQPSRRPSVVAWTLLVLGCLAFFPTRAGLRLLNYDGAVVNIATLVVIGVVLGCFAMYALLLRGREQVMVGLGVVLAVALALGVSVKVETFSGGLWPTLAWRWAPAPDQRLGEIKTKTDSAGGVDMVTTTPDDFPQFLGPDRLNVVTGMTLETDWVEHAPKLVWKREIGAGWSSFAAVNGYAVTLEQRGEKELVTCRDIKTGDVRWVHDVVTRHESVLGYVGPRSTPTIADGRVYALGATGVLRCLNGEDGSVVWLHDLFAERGFDQRQAEQAVWWGRAASPLVHDGRVYVPVGGPVEGPLTTLAAYDAVSGELIWECPGKQASYASPAWAEFHGVAQVLSVNEDYVTGHDPQTGRQLWEFEWPGKSGSDANVSQAIPIDDRSLFISKGYGGDAAVYELAVSDQGVWSVKPRWSKKVLKTKFSNVSLKDGFAYGLDHGVLTCVNLETGQRAWKRGRYNYGQSLLVGDHLLIISEDGEIALAAASPSGYQEFGRVPALEGQTWNNPCLYGNFLLFRSAQEAVCYELSGTPRQ